MEKPKSSMALKGYAIGVTILLIYLVASPFVFKENFTWTAVIVAFAMGSISVFVYMRQKKKFDIYRLMEYIREKENIKINTEGWVADKIAPYLWALHIPHHHGYTYVVDTTEKDNWKIQTRKQKSIEKIKEDVDNSKLLSSHIKAKARIKHREEELGLEEDTDAE